jgi:putative Mg2+ transporter-C (MgtC) family protein
MASAAVTVIVGYPHYWFGGMLALTSTADPTRVIQGIVTGIGFLGAGVIMKEGQNISGLTTAASIWASSAIGILCGAGFYFAAIVLTLVSSATMIWGGYVESALPSRHAAALILHFKPDHRPSLDDVKSLVDGLGFRLAEGSTSIIRHENHQEWHLVLLSKGKQKVSIPAISAGLQDCVFLSGYQVAFARN